MNSIDRTNTGDYLISGRGTNTVYLISAKDGTVVWRIGGKNSPSSDFALQNFTFSAQHDARMLQLNDSGTTIISFLDNASDGYETSGTTSAGLVVALNHTDNTASLVSRFSRPDRGITDRRGNVQALPNGSFQICWSQFGWVTEFDSEGRNVVEARFRDKNLYTYRAYKVVSDAFRDMVPAELPAVTAFEDIGRKQSGSAVMISTYVSWNGGFSFSGWNIYGCSTTPGGTQAPPECDGHWWLLTSGLRQGFETRLEYVSGKGIAWIYAEAMDNNSNPLARSKPIAVKTREIEHGNATPVQEYQGAALVAASTQPKPSFVREDASSTSFGKTSKPVQTQDTKTCIHGLYIISQAPGPSIVGWITWPLLLWCIIPATASVICTIHCLRSSNLIP